MLKLNLQKAFLYLFIIMIVSYTVGFMLLPDSHLFFELSPFNKEKNLETIDEKKELPFEGINTITINTDSPDLRLYLTDESKIIAHLDGNYLLKDQTLLYDFILNQTGNNVKIEVKRNNNLIFFHGGAQLTVFLPSSFKGKLNISTGSADCELPQVIELDEFTFQTGSGDLIANSVTAKRLQLTSASGDLELLEGACEQVSVTTASGEFTARTLVASSATMNTASGTFKVTGKFKEFLFKSASGDLFSDAFESQITKINTASGELSLRGVPGNVEAETMSGNIYLNYLNFGNNITARSMSGNVNIEIPTRSDFSVSFDSASGELTLSKAFSKADKDTVSKKTFKGSFGSDTNKIKINTASGDAKIQNR